jgi:aspartate kinase
MNVVVQKYGGSSVSTIGSLHRVAGFAAAAHRSGRSTVVVVSAQGDTTDDLIESAAQVTAGTRSERTAREVDQLLATGECASAALLAMAVDRLGIPAVSLTGSQAGVLVEGRYGSGVIADIDTTRINRLLATGHVVVIAGFQGFNTAQDAVTLGRGGSDTTAVAVAATLGAPRCEIYTDVDGVYTADPRIFPNAQVIPAISMGVMAEMAFAGAKVLHSRAVELAAMRDIELHVRSSREPGLGTLIIRGSDDIVLETERAVVAITHDLDVARVLVHAKGGQTDLAADVLAALARQSVPVDLVARTGPQEDQFRMGFTVRGSDVEDIRPVLLQLVAERSGGVRIDEDVAKVSLIGMGLLNRPEYAARMISTLAEAGIPISWVSTSQLRTSVIIPRHQALRAVDLLHERFELGQDVVDMTQVGSA